MEVVGRENYKMSSPRRLGILASTNARAKKVAVSEFNEIARVPYLCQIKNIGSGCIGKL